MTLDPEFLRPRIPRLGTITVGRGVQATSQSGREYSQPKKARSLVFHTNDGPTADAVLSTFGGSVHRDSVNYEFDVELEPGAEVPIQVLPFGFRQHMEHWRAAQCVRRCTGTRMITRDGKPTDEPCACEAEMATGAERRCSPHTGLPILVELDVPRFGVWEVKSTAYGSARRLLGTIHALSMVGATRGMVPAVLTTEAAELRDPNGDVRQVLDLDVRIAASSTTLEAIAQQSAAANPAPPPNLPALGSGDDEPPPDGTGDDVADDEERARQAILSDWRSLLEEAKEFGVDRVLAEAWDERHPDAERFGDLDLAELTAWMAHARDVVAAAEETARAAAAPAAPDDTPEAPPPPPDPDDVPF